MKSTQGVEKSTQEAVGRRLRRTRRFAIALPLLGGLLAAAPGSAWADGALVRVDALHLQPPVVTIDVGETVTFVWERDETLTENDEPIELVGEGGAFRSPPIEPGGRWQLRIDRAGFYPYAIESNPSIEGEIRVE